MIHHGTVIDVTDKAGMGRVLVELEGPERNRIAWAFPAATFAGPGHGFFVSPEVGDSVFVSPTAHNYWVVLGFYWTKKADLPEGAAPPTGRVLTTPAGHRLLFDDNGSVEIRHADGSRITLKDGGEVEVASQSDLNITVKGDCSVTAESVKLNDEGGGGKVVTTKHICAFTGAPHPAGSKSVTADGDN